MSKKIAIIGSGFSGLSAASYAAKLGFDVSVYEMHNQPGGRARQYETPEGFVFDMGPSWYWMPDIIENYFNDFNKTTEDFFELVSLNPQFEILFKDSKLKVPESYSEMKSLFESIETGAGAKLDSFMASAKEKYVVGMKDFVTKPSLNWLEFVSVKTIKSALKLDLLTDFRSYVSSYFKDERLRVLMEFPVIFLGASPREIPALYSLMNYGGYALGTHYPMGGFYQLVLAMEKIAKDQGVKFYYNHKISKINVEGSRAKSITVGDKEMAFDYIIASSDYHHSEKLLEPKYRNYTESYWENKIFAPSCLLFYLGLNTKLEGLNHHTLFFEPDLDTHINAIYKNPSWPEDPLFYLCCPSKTDPGVAPEGSENLFLLMPVGHQINDEESIREEYLDIMLKRIEDKFGYQDLKSKIVYKKSYCISDFKNDYNAYGGNAYGLANTLNQTAVLKPKIVNKKVKNLFYTGQLTVPGPGVPPSIISGKIVAEFVSNLNRE